MLHPKHVISIVLLIVASCCLQVVHAAEDSIRLQLKWWHQFQFAGYYAAESKGFYKEEGLKVKLVPGDADHAPIDEVLSGRAQFGIAGSDMLISFANGKPLVAVGALFQHSPYTIISLRNRKINSPSDLIGKTIMASENQGWVELQAVFLKEGIPLSSLHIVTHSWKNTDLLNGKADAMTGYVSVELNQLRKLGVDPSYILPVNYGIDFYGDVLFTLKPLADNNPGQIAKFRRASFKGWEYAMSHTNEMADYILNLPGVKERGVTKDDLLAEAESMRKLILPYLVDIGHMNEGRWQHILDIHKTMGLVPEHQQLDGFLYDETKSMSSKLFRIASYTFMGILVVFLAIILYSISLRRAVRRRTAELETEIVQRTLAQQQLQVSEERLEMATYAAGLGIWDWDLGNDTLYFNDRWKTMLGFKPSELENTFETFTSLLHPDEREEVLKQLDDHISGKISNYQAMIRLRTRDRRWKWVLTLIKAGLRDMDGRAMRLSGIQLDIDGIKKKEIELQQLSRELMNSNRELQQFAYITSHNLRAPVANLLSLMNLFDKDSLSEKNRVFCEKISRCIDNLHSTLDDLNEILSSRVDEVETHEEILFETQLKGILQSISEEIREKQAVITYDFSRTEKIYYPKKVIDSILVNLLVNAIKYKRDGAAPQIHLVTETDGEFVILSVRDNGVGIDMEKYGNKIFGLYQRFHVGKDGKGLGLYIIKNQVESLGGKIAVESIVNQGTMFHVFLKKTDMLYDA